MNTRAQTWIMAIVAGLASGYAFASDPTALSPDLILDVPGAPHAAAMASLALSDLGSSLVSRGQAVAQAAYSVQHQPWALEPVAQPAERLAQVEAAGQRQGHLTDSETNQLL